MKSLKKILVFALQAEAEPFLKLHKFTCIYQKKKIQYYISKDFNCLITGIGMLNMSTTIGWLSAYEKEQVILYNIGCAAGINEKINEWYKISCVHFDTNQFYIDILSKTSFNFSALKSNYHPALKNNIDADFLYDMEGFAFVNSASNFMPNGHFQLYKWVSDSGDLQFYKNTNWKKKYAEKITNIIDEIENETIVLSEIYKKTFLEIDSYITQINESISLTFSQQVKLKNALSYAINNGSDIERIIKGVSQNNTNKNENKQKLTDLITNLYAV